MLIRRQIAKVELTVLLRVEWHTGQLRVPIRIFLLLVRPHHQEEGRLLNIEPLRELLVACIRHSKARNLFKCSNPTR